MPDTPMKTRARSIAGTGLLLVISSAIVFGAQIKTQRDEKFDFTTLKSFAWTPGAPGLVRVWVTADSKSEPVQRQYEPAIMKNVEEQFMARGYTQATGMAPDFLVTYYMLIAMGSSAQHLGQFLPTNAQWGIPWFSPQSTGLVAYPQGTLVLDATLRDGKTIVWRGLAEAKIELENSEAKRAERLKSIIKDLLSKFPKRAK